MKTSKKIRKFLSHVLHLARMYAQDHTQADLVLTGNSSSEDLARFEHAVRMECTNPHCNHTCGITRLYLVAGVASLLSHGRFITPAIPREDVN